MTRVLIRDIQRRDEGHVKIGTQPQAKKCLALPVAERGKKGCSSRAFKAWHC